MHKIINLGFSSLFLLAGVFFRRWWGGWNVPPHWLKIVVGIALCTLSGIFSFKFVTSALIFGIFIGLSFLNPWHGEYMRFGRPDGVLPNPSRNECIAVYASTYGGASLAAALLIAGVTGEVITFAFVPLVCCVGLFYAFFWWLWEKLNLKNADGTWKKFWHTNDVTNNGVVTQMWFVDCPAACGEVSLGAILIGGLPLVSALVNLLL